METNVLIVGGSVAGLSLAYFLSKKGIDCVVVEKNFEIGLKPCAGYIPVFLFKHFKIHGIQAKINEMLTISPKGNVYSRRVKGLIVDRRNFDRGLAIQAIENGAKILLGEKVLNIRENRAVTDRRVIKFDILAGCDGVNSIVADMISKEYDKSLIAYAIQVEAHGVKNIEEDVTYTYFDARYAPGSYVWVYPTGKNSAKIGLGILPKIFRVNPMELLKKFIKEKIGKVETISIQRALIPLYGFRKRLVKNNYLLIGDSASSTDPISGAGISSAVLLSKIASDIIKRALDNNDIKLLEKYEEYARKLIGKRLEHALRRRYFANEIYKSNELLEKNIKKIWITFDEYWKN